MSFQVFVVFGCLLMTRGDQRERDRLRAQKRAGPTLNKREGDPLSRNAEDKNKLEAKVKAKKEREEREAIERERESAIVARNAASRSKKKKDTGGLDLLDLGLEGGKKKKK